MKEIPRKCLWRCPQTERFWEQLTWSRISDTGTSEASSLPKERRGRIGRIPCRNNFVGLVPDLLYWCGSKCLFTPGWQQCRCSLSQISHRRRVFDKVSLSLWLKTAVTSPNLLSCLTNLTLQKSQGQSLCPWRSLRREEAITSLPSFLPPLFPFLFSLLVSTRVYVICYFHSTAQSPFVSLSHNQSPCENNSASRPTQNY